ncbi:uncharacterized protein G2W53_028887 [Senna tora]|uniref:Uncharacterized protein n=1 Tax=Senna tora TaxID=362788 RepID=A0A834T478_9FABA|nr:uncharacterized protein G2W53_028887 [Senna tora]
MGSVRRRVGKGRGFGGGLAERRGREGFEVLGIDGWRLGIVRSEEEGRTNEMECGVVAEKGGVAMEWKEIGVWERGTEKRGRKGGVGFGEGLRVGVCSRFWGGKRVTVWWRRVRV